MKYLNTKLFVLTTCLYVSIVTGSVGESVWHLAQQSSCPFIITESLVDNLDTRLTIDFDGTYTFIDSIFDKQCTVNSKLDVVSNELISPLATFVLIQSDLDILNNDIATDFKFPALKQTATASLVSW